MNIQVEQAVFTSARTTRQEGYQLVSTSPGITAENAHQLTIWGPAHDSLLRDDLSASSVNFHPISADKYCISRTIAGQSEYSARSGRQVYTHCLIIDRENFAKFANNPFRVLSAATASGEMRLKTVYPPRMQTLRLFPVGKPIDFKLFEKSRTNGQPYRLTSWFEAALREPRIVLTGYSSDDGLLAEFFNLLPVEVRPEFSFSTGLKFSQRRPFRILGLQANIEERKRAVRQEAIRLVDLSHPPMEGHLHRHGWANWVLVALRSNLPASAINLMSQLRPDLTLDGLDDLGRKLQVQLTSMEEDEAALAQQLLEEGPEGDEVVSASASKSPPAKDTARQPFRILGHAAHTKFAGSQQNVVSHQLEADSPALLIEGLTSSQRDKLQQLDHLVITSISGRIDSLAQLQGLWPEIRNEIDPEIRLKVQELYLAFALSAWEKMNQTRPDRSLKLATTALDVLTLIFDQPV
ncbi:MAG: hypothetical protein COA78_12225 [Blastopirellula sp.]|nr:MAG: hypothetical protein COA78_12225 [Blastopirellula sp.]